MLSESKYVLRIDYNNSLLFIFNISSFAIETCIRCKIIIKRIESFFLLLF